MRFGGEPRPQKRTSSPALGNHVREGAISLWATERGKEKQEKSAVLLNGVGKAIRTREENSSRKGVK